jgi:hypothetical protein
MKEIKEIFEKNEWKDKSIKLSLGSGPEADWKLILTSAITLIVLLSAWNVRTFLRIDSGGALETEMESLESETTLDTAKLKKTIEYYQAKQAEFDKIKSGIVTTVPDPSI